MSADDEKARRSLINGLVRDGELAQLYHTNVYFRHSIDILARMLPAWVDGLAGNASAEQARQEQALAQMVAGASVRRPRPVFHPDPPRAH